MAGRPPIKARDAENSVRASDFNALMNTFLVRAHNKVVAAKAGEKPTIDLLVISGGGDWGAFGAGVLKGWGRLTGEMARPTFDVVTGVSTGEPLVTALDGAKRNSLVLARDPKSRESRLEALIYLARAYKHLGNAAARDEAMIEVMREHGDRIPSPDWLRDSRLPTPS